jgi:hypothetical protein
MASNTGAQIGKGFGQQAQVSQFTARQLQNAIHRHAAGTRKRARTTQQTAEKRL